MRPSVCVAVPDPFAARDLESFLARLSPGVVELDGDWCVAVERGEDATLSEVLQPSTRGSSARACARLA